MFKIAIPFAVVLISFTSLANQIALTFDDAPMIDGAIYSGKERTERIIQVLKKYHLQSVFFINTERLSEASGTQRVLAYSKAGHLIANHTHSHLRLNTVGPKAFIANIQKADDLLKEFPTFTKLFRYPYLNEGASESDRDEVRTHLQKSDYKNGYVTVDNYDYFINDLTQNALKKGQKVHLDRACSMLNDLMLDGILFYDQIAKEHIGNVKHVLLMHENDIEAHCLEDLILHLKRNKWEIINPTLAFSDPLLQVEPNTLYLGQGRIAAIANVKTGIKYRSQWENEAALKAEFARRKIVDSE